MPLTTESLPITSEDVDTIKNFEFDGVNFGLRLRRNKEFSFFSMDVFNEAGEIIYTSRLVYAYPFVSAVIDLPFQILPIDTTEYFNPLEAETEITEENLGDTVRLYTDIQVS